MNRETMLVELLLGGFFAVACMRAFIPQASEKLSFGNLFRIPSRLERLRRSRWQWFSIVALLLIVRLQRGMPLVLEFTVAFEFLLFFALPSTAEAMHGARRRA